MSESILLHFRAASIAEAMSTISIQTDGESEVYCYPTTTDCQILVTRYTEYALEYEEAERTAVECMLNGPPSCSLQFHFRRPYTQLTCKAAVELIAILSKHFDFIIDDDRQRIWHSRQALESKEFLKIFR